VSDMEKQIHRVIGSYEAAVFAKDVEAFMRLYHPTSRVRRVGRWLCETPSWQKGGGRWIHILGK
jgi:hypothetical protein